MSLRGALLGAGRPLVLIGHLFLAIVAGQAAGPPNLFRAEEEERPVQKEEQPVQKDERPVQKEEQPAQKDEPPQKDERPPQKWALLVGIDHYTNHPSLKFAGADRRYLAAQLVKIGFPAKQVIVMHSGAGKKKLLPSKANIERQLELLLDPTKGLVAKGDLVVVSFSGHGFSRRGKGFLCPNDAVDDDPVDTMIPLEGIYRQIDRSRAVLKLMVIDTSRGDTTETDRGETMSRGFANSLRKPPKGLLLLTSCGEGQKALADPDFDHGVFMHFLIDGLAGKAARDDGDVTLTGLYAYTSSLTRKYVAKKFKAFQLPGFEGRTDGNFELCQIDPEALPERPAPPPNEKKTAQSDGKVMINSIGMKLALIPAGEFMMGSPETEFGYNKKHEINEQLHQVRITRPFYLGVYEVTQAQYLAMMGKNPSEFSAAGPWRDKLKGLNTSFFPVENVSWDDTQEFLRRLSEKEGKHYRLPTEAEWEYACRAGTSDPYSFGAKCNGTEANCNGFDPYGTKTDGPNLARTSRVGSYKPNAFGLYDMHGNVWERCADWYLMTYDTTSLDDPTGPAAGGYRVSRGGAWDIAPVGCRSAARYGFVPSYREFDLGFRDCVDP